MDPHTEKKENKDTSIKSNKENNSERNSSSTRTSKEIQKGKKKNFHCFHIFNKKIEENSTPGLRQWTQKKIGFLRKKLTKIN